MIQAIKQQVQFFKQSIYGIQEQDDFFHDDIFYHNYKSYKNTEILEKIFLIMEIFRGILKMIFNNSEKCIKKKKEQIKDKVVQFKEDGFIVQKRLKQYQHNIQSVEFLKEMKSQNLMKKYRLKELVQKIIKQQQYLIE